MERSTALVLCCLSLAGARCPTDVPPPCECEALCVRCNGSLRSARAALGPRPLPCLRLSDLWSFSLGPRALGRLAPRRLWLSGGDLRSVDDDAFEGQAGLRLLVLAEDRLREVPSAALSRLPDLRTLGLPGNLLGRVRRNALAPLTALRALFLPDNRISALEPGALPAGLRSLSLSRNLLASLNGSLRHLGDLEELFARDNRLSFVPAGELAPLVRLRILHLDRNQLAEVPADLRLLPALSALGLSENRLRSLDGLAKGLNGFGELGAAPLHALRTLDLSVNRLRSVCPALAGATELRELRLSDNRLRRLDCLQGLRHLRALDVARNQLVALAPPPFFAPGAELRIGGNPWKCPLVQIKSLMQRGVIVEGYPDCWL